MTTDPQMPRALAEGRWLYRRLYVFATSLGIWVLLHRIVERTQVQDLRPLAEGLMVLLALMLVLYLVAPTAQQLIALLAELKLRFSLGSRS